MTDALQPVTDPRNSRTHRGPLTARHGTGNAAGSLTGLPCPVNPVKWYPATRGRRRTVNDYLPER